MQKELEIELENHHFATPHGHQWLLKSLRKIDREHYNRWTIHLNQHIKLKVGKNYMVPPMKQPHSTVVVFNLGYILIPWGVS